MLWNYPSPIALRTGMRYRYWFIQSRFQFIIHHWCIKSHSRPVSLRASRHILQLRFKKKRRAGLNNKNHCSIPTCCTTVNRKCWSVEWEPVRGGNTKSWEPNICLWRMPTKKRNDARRTWGVRRKRTVASPMSSYYKQDRAAGIKAIQVLSNSSHSVSTSRLPFLCIFLSQDNSRGLPTLPGKNRYFKKLYY